MERYIRFSFSSMFQLYRFLGKLKCPINDCIKYINCLMSLQVGELESQIDNFEAEMEGLSVKKGKTRPPRLVSRGYE